MSEFDDLLITNVPSSQTRGPVAPTSVTRPSAAEIFRTFFLIGLCGFGGVLPWTRYRLVEKLGWLTASEFSELLAVAQIFPGPNVANIGTILGRRYSGAAGAVAAVTGLYLAPSIIIIGVGYSYSYWSGSPVVSRLLDGLIPAVVGLVLATSVKLIRAVKLSVHSALFIVIPALAVGLAKLPLLLTMLVLAPVAIVWMKKRLSGEAE
jgi:chromate transporter